MALPSAIFALYHLQIHPFAQQGLFSPLPAVYYI